MQYSTINKIIVISVVVGAIADRLPGWLAQIPGTIIEVELQKSALLGTAQVLQHVLKLPGLWQNRESENNTTHGWVKANFFSTTTVFSNYFHL